MAGAEISTVSGASPEYHRDADPAVVVPALGRQVRRAVGDLLSRDGTAGSTDAYDFLESVDDTLLYFGLSLNEWVILGICSVLWLYCLLTNLHMSRAVDPDVFVAAARAMPPINDYVEDVLRATFWAVLFRTALSLVYMPVLSTMNGILPSYYVRKWIGGLTAILLFVIVGLIAVVFRLEELLFDIPA